MGVRLALGAVAQFSDGVCVLQDVVQADLGREERRHQQKHTSPEHTHESPLV